MGRRKFVAALLALPFAAFGQGRGGPPRIGVLTWLKPAPGFQDALRRGLAQVGYTEGKNILIEWRSAEGSVERAEKVAAELVASRVQVIVAVLTPAVQAAKKATRTIPIVMAYAGDPVGAGLVKSLARPEANVTGLSSTSAEISGKRIELLHELLPGLSRVGVLTNGADAFSKPFIAETLAAGRKAKVAVDVVDVRQRDDLAPAIAKLKKAGVRAVIVQGSIPPAWPQMAIEQGIAAMGTQRQHASAGALMYFGADATDLTVRAGRYIDRLLKGAKPAELPIELPTRMELVLNRKTAKALGIAVSPAFAVRADVVID